MIIEIQTKDQIGLINISKLDLYTILKEHLINGLDLVFRCRDYEIYDKPHIDLLKYTNNNKLHTSDITINLKRNVVFIEDTFNKRQFKIDLNKFFDIIETSFINDFITEVNFK